MISLGQWAGKLTIFHLELRKDERVLGKYEYTLIITNKKYRIYKNRYSKPGQWLLEDNKNLHKQIEKDFKEYFKEE